MCNRHLEGDTKGVNDRLVILKRPLDRHSGFLVRLANVWRIAPIRIDKKDWWAWVQLTQEKDFGLLKQGQLSEGNPCV